jgi:hypothetical protein
VQLTFSVMAWGGWSPAYQDRESWADWQKTLSEPNSTVTPALPQVPAMQRRRFSRLSRMMLDVAFQCEPASQCRSVFASRHGELNRTIDLLHSVIIREPLSPMGFSQSVHNTASGLFGILSENRAASTSVAAGTESLSQAMVEAYAQLIEDPSPLLLVFGDDPVPPVYNDYTEEFELPLALGMVLAPNSSGAPKLTLTKDNKLEPMSYGQLLASLAKGENCQGHLSGFDWSLSHD